jgi:hypothetical protein
VKLITASQRRTLRVVVALTLLHQRALTLRELAKVLEASREAVSLATLGSVAVAVGHPPGDVTQRNHRAVSVGHISDAPPTSSPEVP